MPDSTDDTAAVPAHGIAGWPLGGAEPGVPRPDTLPDGAPWPRIRVVTVAAGTEPRLSETVASVARQRYPESRHDLVPPSEAGRAAAAILADRASDGLLCLRAGDLLAPGALAALALEMALTGAAAVAGLRVLFDRGVLAVDLPSLAGGEEAGAPFTGGEILWSRRRLMEGGRLDPTGPDGPRSAWRGLAGLGARLARIGRPVLLQHAPAGEDGERTGRALSIVSLTGTGYAGGAGIAQRRLGNALRLAGHRIADVSLSDESPPAAAEWTDAFPASEAAILGGGHDLVLAGNLHGATRTLGILGRLSRHLPVAVVLHDLFALTGRCAQPKGCPRIAAGGCDASCPTPDRYPQLARRRVAGTYAAKRAVLAARRGPLLLANSAWTLAQARRLAPPETATASLTLAFPTGVFRPSDRGGLRRDLGLPADDVLILISAVIVDGPDKGFSDLAATLRRVARPGLGFVAIGRLDDPGRLGLPNLFSPGPIAEEARLAAWYGACDLHVTASRLETLGQTPIEAGLCGTPTIAYRAGGLTTAVIDGVSGRLVPDEPGALAAAIEDLVADGPARARLGAFARIALENRFSPASAAISLDAVFRQSGLLPDTGGRLCFGAAMLGHFPFAAERHPGAAGTVPLSTGRLVRVLRLAKQAVFGRNLPLPLRRCLYWASAIRTGLRGTA